MTAYLLLLAFVAFLWLIAREAKLTRDADLSPKLLVVSVIALVVMAALRSSEVGADTYNYTQIFRVAGQTDPQIFFKGGGGLYLDGVEAGECGRSPGLSGS